MPTLCLTLTVLAVALLKASSNIKIDTVSGNFIDEFKRTRVFHGMNAVYKIAPWHPTLTGFDDSNTLSEIDSKNLKSWGFNVVRLGVMWPGLEPGARGDYNQTYLDQIETIVDNLAADDIYVLLDLHQDIWHRKFCGEGVPDYVYDLCVSAEPEGTPSFPRPSENASYPMDESGNPTLESCLSKNFISYYLSAEVGAGFQCLYDNKFGLWDAMAGYWTTVASRFSKKMNVIGYELINEPWAGDVYDDHKNLVPNHSERTYLQPLYQHLHNAIRQVDDEKIIFFEGLTIDYWVDGFSQGPGGAEYNDRQALSYHIYCPLGEDSLGHSIACRAIDGEFFAMRKKDASRLGTGMALTEFGATEDIIGDLHALERVTALADKHQQSWMYWQFKYYQDITTITPKGETLYNEDGSVNEDKLRILSRGYPFAVAGVLSEYAYEVLTGRFSMQYTLLPQGASDKDSHSDARTTLVYVNKALAYPNGFQVTVAVGGQEVYGSVLQVVCPTDGDFLVKVVQGSGVEGIVDMTVSNCNIGETCTCP